MFDAIPMLAYLLAPPPPLDGDRPRPRRIGADDADASHAISVAAADVALAERIRAGDRVVFGALYVERYAELLRAAVRLVHSRDTADEIVQDVFLSLWMRRASFVVQTSVRAYLHGAVRFRAASVTRRELRQSPEWSDAADFPELAGESMSPDATLLDNELRQTLLATIRELPLRQREALILWSRHRMGLAELGEALGVSHVAARKLLRKAQDKLQAVLREADAAG